jgi:lysophospholipase L1-like esterase
MKQAFSILLFAISTIITVWAQPVSAQQAPHVAILGDSNTWMGGDDCTGDEAWSKWFLQRYSTASCRSYARSGATWTNTPSTTLNTVEDTALLADNNVIFNQVQRLIEAHNAGTQPTPQLIIIAAGVNDAWFNHKRPQAFTIGPRAIKKRQNWSYLYGLTPDKVLTMAESIVYNCHLLQQAFPQARIVLISPAQTIEVRPALITKASAIIATTASALGIHAIRLDLLSPISSRAERRRCRYTSDGTHTNVRGARVHGKIIARQIRNLHLQFEP